MSEKATLGFSVNRNFKQKSGVVGDSNLFEEPLCVTPREANVRKIERKCCLYLESILISPAFSLLCSWNIGIYTRTSFAFLL